MHSINIEKRNLKERKMICGHNIQISKSCRRYVMFTSQQVTMARFVNKPKLIVIPNTP